MSSLGALARASIRSAHNVGKVEIRKKNRIVSHGSFYCVACVSGRENTKFDDFRHILPLRTNHIPCCYLFWVSNIATISQVCGRRSFNTLFLVPTPSVAKDLMPKDIMSSDPRQWMVFDQLVMAVQRCAEARWRREDLANWPSTIQCLGSDDIISLASSLLLLRVLVLKTVSGSWSQFA